MGMSRLGLHLLPLKHSGTGLPCVHLAVALQNEEDYFVCAKQEDCCVHLFHSGSTETTVFSNGNLLVQ